MKRFVIELLLFAVLSVGIAGFGILYAEAQPDGGSPEGSESAGEAETIPPPPGDTVPRGTAEGARGSVSTPTGGDGGDQTTDEGEQSEIETGFALWKAVRSGEWSVAVGLAIVLLVAGLRSVVLGSWIPWFKTRIGGYVLAFITGAGVVAGPTLAAGQGFSLALASTAFMAGWGAIGMHTAYRDRKEAKKKAARAAGLNA